MFNPLQRIDDLLDHVMDAVKRAAENHDVDALPDLSRFSKHLKESKNRFRALERELADLEVEFSRLCGPPPPLFDISEPKSTQENGPRRSDPLSIAERPKCRLVVDVTQGMINQNLLTLSEHVKAGRIRPGIEMTIEATPSGDLFSSTLLSDGNRLQERGAIARFYRDARVRAGDKVVLTEDSPNHWKLEKFIVAPRPPLIRGTSESTPPSDDNQI